jgi:hypothetical protein
MPKKLMALNLVLAAAAALFVVYIARQILAPMPMPVGSRRTPPPATSAAATETPRAPAGAYNVVAARNLFSPARTEAPTSGMAMAGGGPLVRPNLYGVVVRDGGSIAYLEDPTTKRVAGYRVGDRILGGTVQAIKTDAVTIDAPGGPMDVRLHDPGKPRATPAAVAGTPQPAAAPVLPGVIPPLPAPAAVAAPPQMAQPPMPAGQPPMVMPGQPPTVAVPGQPHVVSPPAIPGRRPLPPNLLRRVPPGMGDAPQQ